MNSKDKKRGLYIFISIIGILLITLGTCTYLALGGKKYEPKLSSSSLDIIDKIRETQIKGGKLEMSPEELNGTLSEMLKQPITKKGVTINGAYLDIKDDKMLIYLPMKYKNLNILPNITGSMEYKNDKLIFKISSIKLGKLKLPKDILMNKIKKYSSEDILIAEDKIEISKYILPVRAEDIYIKDGKIVVDIQSLNVLANSTEPAGSNQNTQENSPNNSQGSIQASNASNSPGNTSNTTKTTSKTANKANNEKILKEISGQLNGVLSSLQTKKEKQIVSTIQSVVTKVSKDPNYPYQAEANWVKSSYKRLPTEERARVKNAILNNVDITKVLRLINIFGV